MIARGLAFLGFVLVVLGVLKFVGVIAFVAAGAVALIVVGLVLLGVAYYVLSPSGRTRL